jgi:hypothetical protein
VGWLKANWDAAVDLAKGRLGMGIVIRALGWYIVKLQTQIKAHILAYKEKMEFYFTVNRKKTTISTLPIYILCYTLFMGTKTEEVSRSSLSLYSPVFL